MGEKWILGINLGLLAIVARLQGDHAGAKQSLAESLAMYDAIGARRNAAVDIRWLAHLAQAAEWFPLLGLLGTVAGILQTFGSISGPVTPQEIIRKYAPAITATGSGLFMALMNILPTWIVNAGRDLILLLAGGPKRPGS